MEFDLSAGRIWRRLTREERLAAARELWADPASKVVGHAQATSLAHDQGLLAEDGAPEPVAEDAARRGVEALLAAYPLEHVRTYLNTLSLQDHDRWETLQRAAAGREAAR